MQTTNKWFGTDANNQTSLCEYGLLCRQIDNGDNYTCIIKHAKFENNINVGEYQITTVSISDLKEAFSASWFDAKGFLSFIGGGDEAQYLANMNNMGIANCLNDMIAYQDVEDIIGSCYSYDTLAEINKRYGFDFECTE